MLAYHDKILANYPSFMILGYCIIINNAEFHQAGSIGPKLPPRKGSEIDRGNNNNNIWS
jgi:hypothetical protein